MTFRYTILETQLGKLYFIHNVIVLVEVNYMATSYPPVFDCRSFIRHYHHISSTIIIVSKSLIHSSKLSHYKKYTQLYSIVPSRSSIHYYHCIIFTSTCHKSSILRLVYTIIYTCYSLLYIILKLHITKNISTCIQLYVFYPLLSSHIIY